MFSFFKKQGPNNTPVEQPSKVVLSDKDIISIKNQIEQILVSTQTENDNVQLAAQYEQIGLSYKLLADDDNAIKYLELSLQHKKTINEGYKALMSLYNAKRAQAANVGVLADIDFWMNKMDEMRNIAKEVTIKRD